MVYIVLLIVLSYLYVALLYTIQRFICMLLCYIQRCVTKISTAMPHSSVAMVSYGSYLIRFKFFESYTCIETHIQYKLMLGCPDFAVFHIICETVNAKEVTLQSCVNINIIC